MFCSASKLDARKIDAIKKLEHELGRPLVAYSCSTPAMGALSEDELLKIKALEAELSLTLVAFE